MNSFDMLQKLIKTFVSDDLDWFFKRAMGEHYEKRRQFLREGNQDGEVVPAIDYIMKSCIDESSIYPPDSVAQWHECFLKLGAGHSHVFQQLLIIYLKLDIANYLAIRERESTVGKSTRAKDKNELNMLDATLKQLNEVPHAFDFTQSVMNLSAGLWALDNDQVVQAIACLSDPAISLTDFFETPRHLTRIIMGTLHQCGNPRMALYMSRIHRYENCDDDYDQLYAFLLVASGQLVDALKYERLFMDHENYTEVLQQFFELCSRLDATRALNCLNLSVEEEEILNQHMILESSRPVTPASCLSQHNYQTRRVTISEAASTPARHKTQAGSHTPRNRSVQQLRKMPSFSDSPARNTRLARKKKVVH